MADVALIVIRKEAEMSRGDRTGPTGQGPMTGRGRGYCAGNDYAGFESMDAGYGRGLGRGFFGRGIGRGFGVRSAAYPQRAYFQEVETPIAKEIGFIKNMLNSLQEKLDRFEKKVEP